MKKHKKNENSNEIFSIQQVFNTVAKTIKHC
jgi:hypothetical protein